MFQLHCSQVAKEQNWCILTHKLNSTIILTFTFGGVERIYILKFLSASCSLKVIKEKILGILCNLLADPGQLGAVLQTPLSGI